MSDRHEGVIQVRFVRLEDKANAPVRATDGSAGWDLGAAEDVTIESQSHTAVGTGIAVEIGRGLVGLLCPRSGLSLKYGVTILNGPGIVDSDYRGELKVILFNAGERTFRVNTGDRIAQLLVLPLPVAEMVEVRVLTETERGDSGLGSTG